MRAINISNNNHGGNGDNNDANIVSVSSTSLLCTRWPTFLIKISQLKSSSRS